ncbi:UNVERIFIED_CONTAM: hypothetical protein ACS92_07780 [Bacillus cereus]
MLQLQQAGAARDNPRARRRAQTGLFRQGAGKLRDRRRRAENQRPRKLAGQKPVPQRQVQRQGHCVQVRAGSSRRHQADSERCTQAVQHIQQKDAQHVQLRAGHPQPVRQGVL